MNKNALAGNKNTFLGNYQHESSIVIFAEQAPWFKCIIIVDKQSKKTRLQITIELIG